MFDVCSYPRFLHLVLLPLALVEVVEVVVVAVEEVVVLVPVLVVGVLRP